MKIALIVVAAIILVVIVLYAYYGGLKSVVVGTKTQGGELLVYKEITGDYKQSKAVMDSLYAALLSDGIKTTKGFGIYYDNPKKVETGKLRSEAGCIIEAADRDKMSELADKYTTKVLPKEEYITTEFPFKGGLSVFVSIMKVYPALNKYVKENAYQEDTPVMEIYDIPNKKIQYRKKIAK